MTTHSPMYDLTKLRNTEFPFSREVTYLNHASVSPVPQSTAKAAAAVINNLAGNAFGYFMRDVVPMFDDFAKTVAAYINAADPLEICPITSTSLGMNLVANALPWQAGDNIILCSAEFPANAYPWMALERQGVEIRLVEPINGTLGLEAVQAQTDAHTRLVAVSAIQFFTGARADLAAIGAFCHSQPQPILFAVDAIQAIGHMPIDVQAMHIDILATGAQKSMMALPGGGFLYVRRDLVETMMPNYIGPNAVDGWEHWTRYDMTPRKGALRFLMGTLDVEGMVSVIHSLKLLSHLGVAHIDHHTTTLAQRFMADIEAQGLKIVTPTDPAWHGPIVTFQASTDNERTTAIWQSLMAQNVSIVQHLDPQGVAFLRISVHCYNNDDDRQHFMTLLNALI